MNTALVQPCFFAEFSKRQLWLPGCEIIEDAQSSGQAVYDWYWFFEFRFVAFLHFRLFHRWVFVAEVCCCFPGFWKISGIAWCCAPLGQKVRITRVKDSLADFFLAADYHDPAWFQSQFKVIVHHTFVNQISGSISILPVIRKCSVILKTAQ